MTLNDLADRGALDVRWRWPWQTREDIVIRLLDEQLKVSEVSRRHTRQVTQYAIEEASRKIHDAEGS